MLKRVMTVIGVLALAVLTAQATEDGLGTNVVRNLRITVPGSLSLGGVAITNWTEAPGSTNAILKEDDFNMGTSDLEDDYNTGVHIKDGAVDEGKLATDAVTTIKILDANVTEAKLATDAVTTIKILDANVTEAKINDGAVTTNKIGTGAVTTIKILDANVTEAKINDGAVTTNKIGAGAVITSKILDANVTEAKINDGAVTTNKIGAGAVITSKILDANVTEAKINDGAVTTNKIGAGAVITVKILDANVTSAKLAEGITISSLTVTNKQVLAPIDVQSVAADAEIVVSAPFVPIKGSAGAVSASIAAGTVAGQTLLLRGVDATDTVQITNNPPGVVLEGGIAFTMGTNDILQLIYNGAGWMEVHRSDN